MFVFGLSRSGVSEPHSSYVSHFFVRPEIVLQSISFGYATGDEALGHTICTLALLSMRAFSWQRGFRTELFWHLATKLVKSGVRMKSAVWSSGSVQVHLLQIGEMP